MLMNYAVFLIFIRIRKALIEFDTYTYAWRHSQYKVTVIVKQLQVQEQLLKMEIRI